MAGETTREVKIVYSVEGTDEAARGIDSVAESLSESGDSAQEASGSLGSYERGLLQSIQSAGEFRGAVQNIASGLGMLSSILGSESEAGAVIGQMARFSSMGIQFGAVFGPTGAVVGGILGAAVPAFQMLREEIVGADDDIANATRSVETLSTAYEELHRNIVNANHARAQQSALSMGLGTLEEQQAAVERERNYLENINRAAQDATLAARQAGDGASETRVAQMQALQAARVAAEARLRSAEQALALANEDLQNEADDFIENGGRMPGQLPPDREGRTRRGGRGARGTRESQPRRQQDRELTLEQLMQRSIGAGGDAVGYAAGLGSSEKVDLRADSEIAAEERLFRLKMQHAEKLDQAKEEFAENERKRVEEQIQQLDEIGSKIGSTFSGAFQSAISGQEKFDVAMAKGAKSLLLQFGTQMVAEGVGALLTAVGFSTLKPDTAATKAAEGAGKIALGLGLGAAGAAISTGSGSSAGAAQKAPRLGPSQQEQGSGASVVVNLNAPAVVAGTTAQVGREIGRTLSASQARFGRM